MSIILEPKYENGRVILTMSQYELEEIKYALVVLQKKREAARKTMNKIRGKGSDQSNENNPRVTGQTRRPTLDLVISDPNSLIVRQ